MILLAIASCLLFFVTHFTGIFITHLLKKWLAIDVNIHFFETFLSGLITSFVYFNIVSFFAPVNYLALFPLLIISFLTFLRKPVRAHFFTQLEQANNLFLSKRNLFFLIPFITLLFVFWIIPPLNPDSPEYHYIAIRWYEQFKTVPGLANVHGRLGFNPASFIISSAWAFTDLIGQSIYPLNGVLVLLFYVWLLKKMLATRIMAYRIIIFLLAILFFRVTLINISSPSADVLSVILPLYCGLTTYELIKAGKNAFGDYFAVLIIACFAVTAKLSAIPSLLIIPFIYCMVLKKEKYIPVVIKTILLMAFILIPWLGRNFLLSGYLLYPIPGSNLFTADWAVPENVLKLDYLLAYYGPRTTAIDFSAMQQMNMLQLMIIWFRYMFTFYIFSLFIALSAIFSPVLWLAFPLLKRAIPLKLLMLWSIYYLAVIIWLTNSPEHRFGLPYLALAITLPVLELSQHVSIKWRLHPAILSVTMCFLCVYYSLSVLKKGNFYFSLHDCWLKPLRDHEYARRNDIHTFPSVNLGNGVKLYLPDDNHACLNASGPCMNWRYGNIEMRGKKIEDGFRNTKDEVKKYFPFADNRGR